MTLAFAAISPHGWPTIPALSDDAEGALATRAALVELGRRARAAAIEAVVIVTPHGIRVEGAVCVADVARGAGLLRWAGRQVELNVPIDAALSGAAIAETRARGLPVARAGFAGTSFAQSCVPLDWGAMVPLWFLGHDRDQPGRGDVLADPPPLEDDRGPAAVIITPSRDVPRATLVAFGRALGAVVAHDPRPIAIVASCDWAHAHATASHAGHPAAVAVDREVVDAIAVGEMAQLVELDEQAAEDAAIDGLWQALVLVGALEVAPRKLELLSYEAPVKYATGMIVAASE